MSTQQTDTAATNYIEIASDIVAAYVSNNSVPTNELSRLISEVHGALVSISHGTTAAPVEEKNLTPAVNPKKSVTDDFIICLNDGKKFKSLKRHLRSTFNLSPEQYRTMWNLPLDYPMVAPNYAKARSDLAKAMGLGSSRRQEGNTAAPQRGRRKTSQTAEAA